MERAAYEICDVCWWEDDGQDDPHADERWGGPNGSLTLSEARENFRRLGAVEERLVAHARPPTPDEL
jgi:cysteine-rich CPCC protein